MRCREGVSTVPKYYTTRKEAKRILFGAFLIFLGIVLGLYMGLWWAFIGGMMQVLQQFIQTAPIDALTVSLGVAKVVFAAAIGWVSGMLLVIPGFAFVNGR